MVGVSDILVHGRVESRYRLSLMHLIEEVACIPQLFYLGEERTYVRATVVPLFDLDQQHGPLPFECLAGAAKHSHLVPLDVDLDDAHVAEAEAVERAELYGYRCMRTSKVTKRRHAGHFAASSMGHPDGRSAGRIGKRYPVNVDARVPDGEGLQQRRAARQRLESLNAAGAASEGISEYADAGANVDNPRALANVRQEVAEVPVEALRAAQPISSRRLRRQWNKRL